MPDLARFQEAFAEALLAPEPSGRLACAPGFGIYRNTCAHGIVEALRATYTTVDCLLGEDGFAAAALDYRRERPPLSPILSVYGAGFPSFLRGQTWTSELPYLADVAELDRLWLEANLAADRPMPGAESPARAGKGCTKGASLALHPATRFAWLDTPAVTIWLAHRTPGGFEALEPEWRPEGALFTRRAGIIAVQRIDRPEYRLLTAAAAGVSADDTAAALEVAEPHADIPALFARIVASGALISV